MLEKIDESINKLSLRERILLVITIAAVIGMLLDMQFLRPLEKKKRSASGKISAYQQQIEEIGKRLASVGGVESGEELSVLGDLTSENKEIASKLQKYSKKLAQSEYAFSVLSQYAEPNQKDLAVTGLKNIRPKLIDNKHTVEENDLQQVKAMVNDRDENRVKDPEWYRHGLVVKVVGSSESLREYIYDLENAQKKMAWDSLVWDQKSLTENELTLYAYTVSEEPYWLKVK